MDFLPVLYIVLAVSALVFAVGVVITLRGIGKNVAHLTQRLDEALRQLEMTAEDLRKTNSIFRGIVINIDHASSNFAHITDGVRRFRGVVDAATKVVDCSIFPTLIGLAGLFAGIKAAVSSIAQRISGNSLKGGSGNE